MRIKVSSISSFMLIVYLFLALYYPPIISINIYHVLALVAYAFIVLNTGIRLYFRYNINKSWIFLFLFIYVALMSIIGDSGISIVLGIFALYFEVFPVCFIIAYFYSKKEKENSLGNSIIIVSLFQAIISCASFFVPSLQAFFIHKYLSYGFNDIFLLMSGWRMYGFSYTLPYAMPVVQSLIAAYCIHQGINKSIKYYIPLPFILFSSIINARIGIVIFIFAAVVVLMESFRPNIKKLMSIIVFVGLIVVVLVVFGKSITNQATRKWLESGIADIFSFLGKTTYSSNSYFKYATSFSNYKFPDSLLKIFFGTGNITIRGNAQYQSDVGFINDIWLGGIFYCLTVVMAFCMKTITFTKYYFKDNKSKIAYSVGFVGVLLMSNIKGRCFAWNEIMVLWMIIYNCYLISKRNRYYTFITDLKS